MSYNISSRRVKIRVSRHKLHYSCVSRSQAVQESFKLSGEKRTKSMFCPRQNTAFTNVHCFSVVSLPDQMTGRPPCDSLLISEISLRLNMLQVPASSPLSPLLFPHTAVMFGSLTQTRSGDRTGKWDVKHLLFLDGFDVKSPQNYSLKDVNLNKYQLSQYPSRIEVKQW